MKKFQVASLIFVQAIFIVSCGVNKIEEPVITESTGVIETSVELISQEERSDVVEESKFVLGELDVQLELREPVVQGVDESKVEDVVETSSEKESVSVEIVNPDTTLGVSAPVIDDVIDYTCISKMEVGDEWIIIEQSNIDSNKTFTLYMNDREASSDVMERFEIIEISEKRVEYFYNQENVSGIALWSIGGINYTIESRNILEEELQEILELIIYKSMLSIREN